MLKCYLLDIILTNNYHLTNHRGGEERSSSIHDICERHCTLLREINRHDGVAGYVDTITGKETGMRVGRPKKSTYGLHFRTECPWTPRALVYQWRNWKDLLISNRSGRAYLKGRMDTETEKHLRQVAYTLRNVAEYCATEG